MLTEPSRLWVAKKTNYGALIKKFKDHVLRSESQEGDASLKKGCRDHLVAF